ncbi:hypothetical protein ACFOOM_01180 [Streptomyces echinoruber]|uniref:Uncharacterized protein n=1 Tax=Streptomyces echinoruber TaxID=68898 RepID=A0A918QXG4_9ACTN|nr:hypothetical protein [Streptomyces echinoruber]GGZ72976.1 hypothetical protein GCM10010389_07970 [Streptomyces echinoruber]
MSAGTWARVALALACVWAGGYATGRGRPVRALTTWADWQVAYTSRRSPWFWLAVPIVAAAIAGLIVFRPRRSLRNWRAARDRDRRRARTAQIPIRLRSLHDQ